MKVLVARLSIQVHINIMKSLLKREFEITEKTYRMKEPEMKALYNDFRKECKEKGLLS